MGDGKKSWFASWEHGKYKVRRFVTRSGERTVAETLGMGTEWKDKIRGLQDDPFC